MFSVLSASAELLFDLYALQKITLHTQNRNFWDFSLSNQCVFFFFSSDMPFYSFLSIKFTCKDVYSLSRCVSTVFWLKAALISCRPMIFNFFFPKLFAKVENAAFCFETHEHVFWKKKKKVCVWKNKFWHCSVRQFHKKYTSDLPQAIFFIKGWAKETSFSIWK